MVTLVDPDSKIEIFSNIIVYNLKRICRRVYKMEHNQNYPTLKDPETGKMDTPVLKPLFK